MPLKLCPTRSTSVALIPDPLGYLDINAGTPAGGFVRMDKYPICSWVVAYAFEKVGASYFDIKPNAAAPDDIWDYIQTHPDKFVEIYPLSFLNQATPANPK